MDGWRWFWKLKGRKFTFFLPTLFSILPFCLE